jgi:branched-chain amino acid transport system ATP-binding protein
MMASTPSDAGAEPLLRVSNLECAYGPVRALHGISLEVGQGQIVTVLGANGAGKSTVLKAISGTVLPKKGAVQFAGQDVTGWRPAQIVRSGIAHSPEGREVFALLSVHDNLTMGAFTRSASSERQAVAEDMERMYAYFPVLRERSRQLAGTLSGGQQQMLAIARALMARPRLLLLDEPSLGLSPLLTYEVFQIVARVNRELGTAVLLVEQNAQMALELAQHGYVLEVGRIVMSDSSARLSANADIQEFYLGSKAAGVRGERRWKKKKQWR